MNAIIHETAEALQARIDTAIRQRDVKRLEQLHDALTKHLAISNSAGLGVEPHFDAAAHLRRGTKAPLLAGLDLCDGIFGGSGVEPLLWLNK